jgi:F-type H+-transporting ATPase subunit epsilon
MAGTFKFELVSPERVLLSEDAEQVVVPGRDGDFGVLPGHAPVISTLRPGVLDITLPSGKRRVFVKGGFADVDPNRLTVLAQSAIDLDNLSSGTIADELRSAEETLADAKDDLGRLVAGELVEQLRALQR